MKWTMFVLAASVATVGFAVDGTWEAGRTSNWGDTASWVDGVIPDGGTANLAYNGDLTLGTGNPAIARLVFTGSGNCYLRDGQLPFTSPAVVSVAGGGFLQANANTLSIPGDLTVTGGGNHLMLQRPQAIGGRLVISDGWVRADGADSFGPPLSSFQANAIELDNGTLQNGTTGETVLDPNRGIYVTARGGYLEAGYHNAVLKVTPPVTGPGALGVNYEFSAVEFLNPANAWQGDTTLGTLAKGYNMNTLHVRLGADEVIPHGADAGVLRIAPTAYNCNSSADYRKFRHQSEAFLDMFGHTESVNALDGGLQARLASDTPARLNLVGDQDSNFRGEIRNGVTVAQNGAGTLDLSYGKVASGATVELNAGRLKLGMGNLLADGKVVYNGGMLALVPFAGLGWFRGTTGSDDLQQGGIHGYPACGGRFETRVGERHVYRARWTLPAARTYSFLKSYQGRAALVIDGTTILDDADRGAFTVVRDVALAAGEHDVRLEFAVAENGNGSGLLYDGIMFDPENGSFETEEELDRARYFSSDFGDDICARGVVLPISGALHLNADCTLAVDPDVGPIVFAGPLSSSNGAVLSVPAAAGKVYVGSPDATRATVFEATIAAEAGLVLTNNVWLRAAPVGGYEIASGTSFTLDYPGAFEGNLDLADTSARLTTEGLGNGTVTIHAGQSFRFDTQSFQDGTILDDATQTRTYANAIVLDGGTLYFAGAGTTTYTGTITGAGTIEKVGNGTVVFNGDAGALTAETTIFCSAGRFLLGETGDLGTATIRTNGGRFGVPDGVVRTLSANKFEAKSGGFDLGANARLTITGFVEGIAPVSTWGSGTLALAGEGPDNTVRFHLRDTATLELAKGGSTAAVYWIQGIEPGARAVITGDSTHMITTEVRPNGGVFDLNGHDLTLTALLDSGSGKGGTIVNNGATAATLTIDDPESADNTFSGDFAAGTAPLTVVKAGAGQLTLDGGTMKNAAWSFTRGTTSFLAAGAVKAKYVRFRALASRPTGSYTNTGIQFSEIRFLLDGEVVPFPAGSTATAPMPGANSGENATKILDGNLNSKWYAGDNSLNGCVNTIEFAEQISFDAYQFATANDATGRDPYSWTIEASQDGESWTLVDTQTEVSLTEARRVWDDHVFSVKGRSNVFAAEMPITVGAEAKVVLSFVDETLENFTCAGELGLADEAEVTLTGTSAITGSVTGAGRLALATGAATTPAFTTASDVTVVADGTDTLLALSEPVARTLAGPLADGTAALGVCVDAEGAELTLVGGDATSYTGPTTVEQGSLVVAGLLQARFFRFTVKRTTRLESTHMAQLSRIDLLRGDDVVAWPDGTTSTTGNAASDKGEGAPSLIDGNVNTKCFWGNGEVLPVVITCPEPVSFSGYDWYTANDSIQYNRQPISWSFEYSQDGENWTLLDEVVDSPDTPNVQNYQLAYTYGMSEEGAQAMNAIGDASVVTVAEHGTFAVVGAQETIGGLVGDGTVNLSVGGSLVFGAVADAAFAGNISGSGSLVMKGAARQALSGTIDLGGGEIVVASGVLDLTGASLAGVSRIVLKGGTLVGTAALDGDVTVVGEGGAYGAALTVSGRLTLTGDLQLAAGFAGQALRRTAFAYGSTDTASQQVFRQAVLLDELPKGWVFAKSVSGRGLVFSVAPACTILYIR